MSRASAAAPIVVATGIAALMLWLAAGPFDPPPALPPVAILAPQGPVPEFPRRFAWQPVPGADAYEVTVANRADGRALFRQRGPTTTLDLAMDPAAEPPDGEYVWEVLAYREGRPAAQGFGRFLVGDAPAK